MTIVTKGYGRLLLLETVGLLALRFISATLNAGRPSIVSGFSSLSRIILYTVGLETPRILAASDIVQYITATLP